MRLRSMFVLLPLLALSGCGSDHHPTAPFGARLEVIDMSIGSGPAAASHDTLEVTYVGRFPDSTAFDSTRDRPFTFVIGTRQVILGLDQGLLGMRVGGSRRVIIPPAYGYGHTGAPPVIPPDATLVYDVTLLRLGHPIVRFPI